MVVFVVLASAVYDVWLMDFVFVGWREAMVMDGRATFIFGK
jgi:hypothetical protein